MSWTKGNTLTTLQQKWNIQHENAHQQQQLQQQNKINANEQAKQFKHDQELLLCSSQKIHKKRQDESSLQLLNEVLHSEKEIGTTIPRVSDLVDFSDIVSYFSNDPECALCLDILKIVGEYASETHWEENNEKEKIIIGYSIFGIAYGIHQIYRKW